LKEKLSCLLRNHVVQNLHPLGKWRGNFSFLSIRQLYLCLGITYLKLGITSPHRKNKIKSR
jgi:hypothetical protein